MSSSNIVNGVAVVPVANHSRATGWYAQLLGREADLVPMEAVAEWQLADSAWLQVTTDEDRAGSTTVIIGVKGIHLQRSLSAEAGVAVGDVVEYPEVIKMAETLGPAGNTVVFVQDISGHG